MADLVTMEQVRERLRVDAGTDAALIATLVAAAIGAIEQQTGRTIEGGDDPLNSKERDTAALVALLLVSTWYDNPESVAPNGTSTELPLAVTWLLWPLKRLVS